MTVTDTLRKGRPVHKLQYFGLQIVYPGSTAGLSISRKLRTPSHLAPFTQDQLFRESAFNFWENA